MDGEAVWLRFLGSGWGQVVRSGLGAGCEVRAGGRLRGRGWGQVVRSGLRAGCEVRAGGRLPVVFLPNIYIGS